MEWIRTDLYSPGTSPATNDTTQHQCEETTRPRRCPLHKLIRQRSWSAVLDIIRQDPSQVLKCNSYGWSSITLAVYHTVPTHVLSEMLQVLTKEEQTKILAKAVPNGNRLCLHFAARYLDDLEAIRLLTEAYPSALLLASSDGIRPLDRALYYRKDNSILEYLSQMFRKQQDIERLQSYNQNLRFVVVQCCHRHLQNCQHTTSREHEHQDLLESGNVTLSQRPSPLGSFVAEIYIYSKEREMIGLFQKIVSYVGVSSIP